MSGLTLSDIRHKVKHRLTGYNHLDAFLSNKTLISANKNDYEHILHALFSAIQTEKDAFVENESSKGRLIYAGDLLKTFIGQIQLKFGPIIAKNTIAALKDAFLDNQDGVCIPLVHILSKTWLCILENGSHIDTLSHEEFLDLITFTCNILEKVIESVSQIPNARPPPATTELFKSLECFVSARPNSIRIAAPNITPILLSFLHKFQVISLVHSVVLNCLNELLLGISVNDPQMSRDLCLNGLKRIVNLADSKIQSVRENCLLFICHSYPVILYHMIIGKERLESINEWVIPLFKKLIESPNNQYLEVSDLDPRIGRHTGFLDFGLFRLNPHGNYGRWLLVLACTRLAMLCTAAERFANNEETLDVTYFHKDLDVQGFLNSQGLESTLIYLQILAFSVQETQLSGYYASGLISDLLELSNSTNSDISSWSLICYGCIVYCSETNDEVENFSNVRSILWDRACKKLFETKTSTSTVFMANLLIESSASIDDQAVDIERYIRLWDSHTPSLDHFSINLCHTLLHLKTGSSSLIKCIYFRMYDWLSNAWKAVVLNANFSLSASLAPSIAQCLLLLSGTEVAFGWSSLYLYEGHIAYHDLRSTPLYEIWDYLNFKPLKYSFDVESDHVTEAPVDIPGDPVSLLTFCTNILRYFIGSDQLYHRQTMHFLFTYVLIIHHLHDTQRQSCIPFHMICQKLKESILPKSNQPTASVLHEMTGFLASVMFFRSDERTITDIHQLSSTLTDILRSFYSQESNIDENPTENPTEDQSNDHLKGYLFCSSDIISSLHTCERLDSNIYIQRAQWLTYLHLIDSQNQETDFSQYLCDLIVDLCSNDGFILWFFALKNVIRSDIFTNKQFKNIVEALGSEILGRNPRWSNSEIALSIITYFVRLTVPIWTDDSLECTPNTRNILTDVEDLINFIKEYIHKVFDIPYHLGLYVGGMFCSALTHNMSLKFSQSDLDVRAQLISLISQSNNVLSYHLADDIAELLYHTALGDQLELYLQIYTEQSPQQVTAFLLRCRNISVLVSHEFHISLLMSTLLQCASWGDPYKAYIRRIITEFQKQSNVNSCHELFRAMMPSIIDYWFDSKSDLDAFPLDLCGYKSILDLERDNFVVVLSHLIEIAEPETALNHVQVVATDLGMDIGEFYSAIFPRCLASKLTGMDEIDDLSSVLHQVVIPIGEVRLSPVSISFEILSNINLSSIPEQLIGSSPFSALTTFRTLAVPMKPMLSVEKGMILMELLSKHMGRRDFTSLLSENGIFLGILIKLLGFNSKYTDPEAKRMKIRQGLLLLFNAGIRPFHSGLVTDMAIRMFLCYLSDDDLCDEVVDGLIFILESATKNLVENSKYWIGLSCSIIYSIQQAEKKIMACEEKLTLLSVFLENHVFKFMDSKIDIEADFEMQEVLKLARASNNRLIRENANDILDESTIISLMSLKKTEFKSISRLFFNEIIHNNYSSLLNSAIFFSNASLLLDELQDLDESENHKLKSWIGRIVAEASLKDGTIDRTILECPVEDQEGKVPVAIVDLAAKQLESHDAEIIAAATHAIQQLIFKNLNKYAGSSTASDQIPLEIYAVFGWEDSVIDVLEENSLHPFPELPYDDWVKQLSINLLPSIADSVPGVAGLQPLMILSSSFCDAVLPVMLQAPWTAHGKGMSLTSHLLSFYLKPQQNFDIAPVDYLKKRQKMIQILCSLRVADNVFASDPLSLLDTARTAYEIGMFKTAFLLLELCRSRHDYDTEAEYKLLSEICSNIDDQDDPDLKYIIPGTPSLQRSISVGGGKQNDWVSLSYQAAMFDNDIMSRSTSTSPNMLVSSLNQLGMQGLSRITNEWDGSSCADNSIKYAYGWKLMQWDIPIGGITEENADRNEILFKMFRNIDNIYRSEKNNSIDRIFSDIYANCMDFDISTTNLSTMAIVRDCEDIFKFGRKAWKSSAGGSGRVQSGSGASGPDIPSSFGVPSDFHGQFLTDDYHSIDKWMKFKPYNDIEDLLTARQIAWRLCNQYSSDSAKFNKYLSVSLTNGIKAANQTGLSHQAMNLTLQLGSVSKESLEHPEYQIIKAASLAAEANVMWDIGNQSHAINVLQSAIDSNIALEKRSIGWWNLFNQVDALSKLIEWSYKARSDKQENIRQNYLKPALSEIERWRKDLIDKDNLTSLPALNASSALVYHTFAIFCEEQLKDSAFEREMNHLEEQIERKNSEIEELNSLLSKATGREKGDIQRHLRQVTRLQKNDIEETSQLKSTRQTLLVQSIDGYLKSMSLSNNFMEDAARFLALWFSHSNQSAASEPVKACLRHVPRTRFVPWINQLTSHMTTIRSGTSSLFNALIESLIVAMCEEHPHHCLYQVLALRMISATEKDRGSINRSQAGHKVWRLVGRRGGQDAIRLLTNVQNLVVKTMELANNVKQMPMFNQEEPATKRRKLLVPKKRVKNISLKDIKGSEWWNAESLKELNLPPPSLEIPLRVDNDYSSVPVMTQIYDDIRLATGLSRPMIVKIGLSDGTSTRMVIKHGVDDLRQDAIMEQVFDHVNGFLRSSVSTSRRRLKIRTYRVVPLCPNVGVLEFVDNAQALADILEPLHTKYRPKDITTEKARQTMSQTQTSSIPERIKTYKRIEDRLKPVMSKFFLEKFFSPDDWFKTRTQFTRSNATASILGYVIGLGDRHCRNILLDTNSGDVVHIDLGVAFDHGKSLQTPETVPFRLTRDIVDGMGMPGTNGTFQKCSELTLDVLRKETLSILTIFNVLKYDPLYNWTLAPLKKKVQTESYQREEESKEGDSAELGDAGDAEDVVGAGAQRSTGARTRSRARKGNGAQGGNGAQKGNAGQGGSAAQGGNGGNGSNAAQGSNGLRKNKEEQEEQSVAEADRALTSVRKKLSTDLSSEALIRELIRQAESEENLALIYYGKWGMDVWRYLEVFEVR